MRISNLFKRHTTLKQTRRGKWLGLCPFHEEKTPSFTVDDNTNTFKCFGCGARGWVSPQHDNTIRFTVDKSAPSISAKFITNGKYRG